MCFSASASFGAGVVLSVIGVASIKKVKQPSQFIFASIPLVFALQQITEGFLWLALTNPAYAFIQQATTYTFLFFVQVVWPIWVLLAMLLLEKDERRKKIQKIFLATGILVSTYLAYCLVTFTPIASNIGYHITYQQNYLKGFSRYGGLLYMLATVVSPLFSSVKKMWAIGTTILISYIITDIFYENYITSVWCFFASIISISVFWVMYKINAAKNTEQA